MNTATENQQEPPRISHRIPGRIRIHFPRIVSAARLEEALHKVPGVRAVKINSLTGSVLVSFEDRYVDGWTIYEEACRANRGGQSPCPKAETHEDLDPLGLPDTYVPAPVPSRSERKAVSPEAVKLGVELIFGILGANLASIVGSLVVASLMARHDSRG